MHATMAAPLSLVLSPLVFWPYFAGAALTLIGVFAVRRELTEASGLDKIPALEACSSPHPSRLSAPSILG